MVLMLPFYVIGGISNSSSGILIVAYSDFTTDLLRSAEHCTFKVNLVPKSPIFPPNCTSLFEKPHSSQLNDDIMISILIISYARAIKYLPLKKGILVNKNLVIPCFMQFMHNDSMLSATFNN